MNSEESTYFAYDREELMQSLRRFDRDTSLTVEDVTDGVSESDNSKYYHTVLLQILLEAVCKSYVDNEQQREILLKGLCRRLSNLKIVNSSLLMDKENPLRIALKQNFFRFVKEVLKDVIPDATIDDSAVSFLENNNLTSDPDFCYHKCFEELQEIGRGGFGVVYKAREKLTHHICAVKKISFNYKSDEHFLKVMREAKNIASLQHPNVVRYYTAWTEVLPSGQCTGSCVTSEDPCENASEDSSILFCSKGVSAIRVTEDDSTACSDSSSEIGGFDGQKSSDSINKSFQSVIFSNSAECSTNISWKSSVLSRDEETYEESFSRNSDDSSTDDDDATDVDNVSYKSNLNVRGVLYIQMEYCDCDLRFWLDERAKGNKLPFDLDITEIFSNILKGLVHVHSKNIIHRDLKPQNVFFSNASNVLKIGDFGLATLSGASSFHLNKRLSKDHSANVGTRPYAAPEQLASNSYDSKVDIYSLGIILLELMNTFSTSMEFSGVLKEVKEGKITEEMKNRPDLVEIVTNLISINPEDRMSAEEILVYFEKDTKVKLKQMEKYVQEMEMKLQSMTEILIKKENIIKDKDSIIKEMQTEFKRALSQKDEEIKKLRATFLKSCRSFMD